MDYRVKGKTVLQNFLSKKDCSKIENAIFKISDNNTIYFQNIYNTVGDLIDFVSPDVILENIKKEKVGWKHNCFTNVKNRIMEQDDFIINPFEVEEGVLECRCGSKRVFSYSKQVRSSDEPTTTFAQCMACKACWKENA